MNTKLDTADFIIDGKQAVELDTLCKEYESAKIAYKLASDNKNSLASDIKTLLDNKGGRHVTSAYEVLLTVKGKSLTVDLEKLAEIEPDLFEQLVSKYPKVKNGSVTLHSVTPRKTT